MAPRAPESLTEFLDRLAASADGDVIRFGQYHHSHAVCREDGLWRVRRLEHTQEEAEAYLAEHGYFMPESAEAISKPRTLVFEASSLAELAAMFRARPWPW